MEKIIFRQAETEDAKELSFFMEQLVDAPCDYEKLVSKIETIRGNDMYYLCVASIDEKIVGTAMGILCEDICEHCQRFMVVENVFVHEEYRGRGIIGKIFAELEQWAKCHDAYYAILVSENYRTTAHKAYEKIGYHKYGGFKKFL